MGQSGNGFKILTGKPTGKRLLEMPLRKYWAILEQVLNNLRYSIDLAQNRDGWRVLANLELNLGVS